MKINFYGSSSVGRVRKINEDSFSFDSKLQDKGSIFLVCDGMGGHKAGEVASQYASKKTIDYFYSSNQKDILSKLNEAIKKVNIDIYNFSQKDRSKRGMGTTLVAVVLFEGILYFANVGDSRVYIIRNNSIKRLTKDHSWLEERIIEGLISPEEARNNPNKNIITKCVGYDPNVEPNLGSIPLKEGDRIILCSDGLWDELDDLTIKDIALSQKELKKAVDFLILSAEKKGGKDNITVVAIDYGRVKINKIRNNKADTALSVISILAVFFLISAVTLCFFYLNTVKENQRLNLIVEESSKEFSNSIKDLQEKNKALEEELDNLLEENSKLKLEVENIKENEIISESLNEILTLDKNFNINEHIENTGIIKKIFIDNNRFLFLTFSSVNRLFFLDNNNIESPLASEIKLYLTETNEGIGFDNIFFNNNDFFSIHDNVLYKNDPNGIMLDEGSINIHKVKELQQSFQENNLAKIIIIQDILYYLTIDMNYDNSLDTDAKTINLYNISENDNINQHYSINLNNITHDIESIDCGFDSENQILYLLLKNENINSLLAFKKIDSGFELTNSININSSDTYPEKILVNKSQNSAKVIIYFNNGSLNYYDEDLELIKEHLLLKSIENTSLKIIDIFINNGSIFVLDDSNNVYSASI